MVVDDNTDILYLTSAILERLIGVPVECFHSPQAALAAFQKAPERYEFVITDFDMPGMDGEELCRRLHEIDPALKVLLSTGSGIVSDDIVEEWGFCGCLHKPFPLSQLKTILVRAGILPKNFFEAEAKVFSPAPAALMVA